MITNTSMTIYNRYTATGAEAYQRSVIDAVAWENTKAVSGAGAGRLSDNAATVYIPKIGQTAYTAPKAWLALANKAGKWTLREGDIIVKGTVTDSIAGTFTITSLKAKYDNVLVITSVDTMDNGSPELHHWQVGAK
jgi:hypothetical protein